MASVSRSPAQQQIWSRILQSRPFHPWHLMDLAAYLCGQGYSDSARGQIMDKVEASTSLDLLVEQRLLEPADLTGAQDALAAGLHALKADPEPFHPGEDGDAPYHPSPADWESYRAWSESIAMMREWYRDNPDFHSWLESQGGDAE